MREKREKDRRVRLSADLSKPAWDVIHDQVHPNNVNYSIVLEKHGWYQLTMLDRYDIGSAVEDVAPPATVTSPNEQQGEGNSKKSARLKIIYTSEEKKECVMKSISTLSRWLKDYICGAVGEDVSSN